MDETVKLEVGGPRLLTPTQSNILNLSLTYTLHESEKTILEKGLFFIPTPLKVDKNGLCIDLHKYHRRLKLLDHFEYDTGPTGNNLLNPPRGNPKDNLSLNQ